jgi:hypothetical protein
MGNILPHLNKSLVEYHAAKYYIIIKKQKSKYIIITFFKNVSYTKHSLFTSNYLFHPDLLDLVTNNSRRARLEQLIYGKA